MTEDQKSNDHSRTDSQGRIRKGVGVKTPPFSTVYGKRSFLSKESDALTSYRVYIFAYDVGIISSYSNRIQPLSFII